MGKRISELPLLSGQIADDDIFEMVDRSDTSISLDGTSKRFTGLQIKQFIAWRLKDPVHTVLLIPVTLATALVPGQTAGGRLLEAGDRVLATTQADPGDNGIWEVQASGPPVRPSDFVVGMDVSCALVPVGDGDSAGSLWICTSRIDEDLVGTDALYFSKLTGASRYDILEAADGPTVVFDLQASPEWTVTIAGNRNLTLAEGGIYRGLFFNIAVAYAGNYAPSWDFDLRWPDEVEPDYTSAVGRVDEFCFKCVTAGDNPVFRCVGVAFNIEV